MSDETAEIEREESSAYAAPLTEREWRRILRDQPFRVLVSDEQIAFAGERAVRCITCSRASDAGHDPWRAFCLASRVMVSNTFAKLCPKYERQA